MHLFHGFLQAGLRALCQQWPMHETQLFHNLTNGSIILLHRGLTVWRYTYKGVPKPFVHPFATPDGEVLSLTSPHDHIHHRGLALAWRVNGINFWEESPTQKNEAVGRILHEAWESISFENESAALSEQLAWIGPDESVCLRERRELHVRVDPVRKAVFCQWSSVFRPEGGDALISGYTVHSPISYYGLGFRFARALDHGGTHSDSEGGLANGERARWHHYSGHLDETGTPVGVLMADSPANPSHPTSWFHISNPPAHFAFVSASPVAKDEISLRSGSELALTYAIWGHSETWSPEQCENAWRECFSK